MADGPESHDGLLQVGFVAIPDVREAVPQKAGVNLVNLMKSFP